MSKQGDLFDVVSLFVYCTDGTVLLILNSNPSEFWIPGIKILPTSNIQKEVTQEINDLFGCQAKIDRVLCISRISVSSFLNISHYVILICCTPDQKRKSKNSSKYRGKVRWLHENEMFRELNMDNQKSPEIVSYYMMMSGKPPWPLDTYDGLQPEIFMFGNLLEINENVFVGSGTTIYHETVESAGFTISVQQEILKKFLTICFPAIYMCKAYFAKVMVDLGWSKIDAQNLFRAADLLGRGGLSFRDFLYILAAVEPTTNHYGGAAELRCKLLFRFLDNDRDGLLSFDEFKNIFLYIKRSKKLPDIAHEAEDCFKLLNYLPQTNKLTIADFMRAVGDLKFKGSSQVLRSNMSIKALLDLKEKVPVKSQSAPIPLKSVQTISTVVKKIEKKTKISDQYNIALHTVRVRRSGTQINVQQIWQVEDALSMTVMMNSPKNMNDPLIKTSLNVFNQQAITNELLRNLRLVFQKNRYSFSMKTKTEQYCWDPVDSTSFASYFIQVCASAEKIFASEPRLLEIISPAYIMGDLHGNFGDLLYFEKCFWSLGPTLSPCTLLFLGDYVDRGFFGMEVIAYLFAYKVQSPIKIKLVRGNHEIRSIQDMFTFHTECVLKFGAKIGNDVWHAINTAFNAMPVAAVIDNKIFCCHGGIPPPWLCPVAEAINSIPTILSEPDEQSSLAWELMWNDPVRSKTLTEAVAMELMANEGFAHNTRRGTAHVFSAEAVNKFLATNGYTHIIRAHEVAFAGFSVHQNCKVLTVFSSSKYCGGQNDAACILVHQSKLRILRLENPFKNVK